MANQFSGGVQVMNPHERRKGQKGRAPIFDKDLLRHLAGARMVRRNNSTCEASYRACRSVALERSYGYSVLDAKVERIRAEIACRESERRMFAEFGQTMASIRQINAQLRVAA